MAILVDTTVSGAGDVDGYQPGPLTLYNVTIDFGFARSHDSSPSGRWFDLGYFAPYFNLDPFSTGAEHYLFDAHFLQYAFGGFSLHEFAGGIDGFHYDLGPGVSIRFLLTDD